MTFTLFVCACLFCFHKLENYGIEQKKKRYDFRVENGLKYGDPGDFTREQLRRMKIQLARMEAREFFFFLMCRLGHSNFIFILLFVYCFEDLLKIYFSVCFVSSKPPTFKSAAPNLCLTCEIIYIIKYVFLNCVLLILNDSSKA